MCICEKMCIYEKIGLAGWVVELEYTVPGRTEHYYLSPEECYSTYSGAFSELEKIKDGHNCHNS